MSFSIQAKKRNGQADETRLAGEIPGVLYGPEMKSVSITLNYSDFDKLYNTAGGSSLIDFTLEGDSKTTKVLIQDLQREPLTDKITHVDLRQINMNKEMSTVIKIELVGEAPAVKGLGGTLIKGPESLNIKCLPKDLVGSIKVDLGILKTFDAIIRISDLALPEGIKVIDNPNTVVAKVAVPLTEEQLKAMEEVATPQDLSQLELSEKKGKKEEEGEAAPEETK